MLPPHRPEEAGAEVPLLPLDSLNVLAKQLDHRDLGQALLLLKLFIVLCRWPPWGPPQVGLGGTRKGVWRVSLMRVTFPVPRNLENLEAGWAQVLLPQVLSLLTGLVAEVRGALVGLQR